MQMSDQEYIERPDSFSLRDFYYILFRHKKTMILFFLIVVAFVAFSSYSQPDLYRSDAKLLMRMGRDDANLDPTLSRERTGPGRSLQNEINSEMEIIKSREFMQTVVADIGVDRLLNPEVSVPMQKLKSNLGSRLSSEATASLRKLRNAVTTVRQSLSSVAQTETATSEAPIDPNTESDTLTAKAEQRRIQSAISTILANLKVTSLKDTSVITLAYELPDPNLAQIVLDTVVDRYLEKHIVVHQTQGSLEFFEEQASQLHTQLATAENELQQLKDSSGISSIESQRNGIIQRVGAIEQSIASAHAELAGSQAKTEQLKLTMEAIPEMRITSEQVGVSRYAIGGAENRVFDLQLQEQKLLSKYKVDSEPVKRIRREIANSLAMLKEKQEDEQEISSRTRGISAAHQSLLMDMYTEQVNYVGLQTRVGHYQTQLAQAQEELRTINAVEVQTAELQRKVDLLGHNYRKYSEKLADAHIDQTLRQERISNINVIQAATLPLGPLGSKRQLHLALAVLMGLFGSLSLAFMAEHVDHSINTPEQVEQHVQLPTLASVQRLRKSHVAPASLMGRERRRRKSLAEWRVADEISETYEAIVEQIIDAQDRDARVIAVVSSLRREGVTSVAANLSINLAKKVDGPVLLADANSRNPKAHRVFNKQLNPEFAEDIKPQSNRDKDAVFSLASENIYALRNDEETQSKALCIVQSDKFSQLINEVKQDYSYIVLDLPAALLSCSSIKLAGLCDKVILVAEAGRTRWEVLQRTTAQLQRQKANLMGVILNKRRYPIPKWVYRSL
jgi:uncharacterized protein involved in exopolysaccharide biosynthesis/Mrp family chromosome partitioning ATPase